MSQKTGNLVTGTSPAGVDRPTGVPAEADKCHTRFYLWGSLRGVPPQERRKPFRGGWAGGANEAA